MNGLDPSCVRLTSLPHTSRLFEDFSYHFERVARFYAHNPHDPEAVRAAAAGIDYPDDRRAAIVAALRRQNGDSESLDLLSKPGTVAVVTGQQVGLFSGPAYTIYKALTAAKVAAQLTEQGIPAVPVFWLATEDHDFAEVDHAWTFDASTQPMVLRAESDAGGSQRPVGTIALDRVPVLALRESLAGFPFGSEVADLVESAYPAGVPMGTAFQNLLKSLLSKFGLLFLDPLAEDIRDICAPFLRQAALNGAGLKTRIEQQNHELIEAGYHAQVHVEAQTSLLFLIEGGRRTQLKFQNGEYVSPRGTRYTAAQLAERGSQLSPNALLRPVMQDFMLPTVMYVGGPAELAYLAQAKVLYDDLLGRMPVAMHRSGFTLLDARAKKLITRYQLVWPSIYEGEEGIRAAIGARLVPPQVQQALAQSHRDVEAAIARVGSALSGFDATLAAALEKSHAKIAYQLTRIERKTERESLRRDARAGEEAHYLGGLLYPNKHLQERLYTILPFLAKHGFDLFDVIYDNIRLDCPDHQVLVV